MKQQQLSCGFPSDFMTAWSSGAQYSSLNQTPQRPETPELLSASRSTEARRISENDDILGLAVIEAAAGPFIKHIRVQAIGMKQTDVAIENRAFRLDVRQVVANIAHVRLQRLPSEQPAITMDNVVN